ncbi:hypothetical protein C1H46_041976 [Malus baccata]|uniref:MICOS complex subunit MIC60 n=1 Tax=Malus baccata TaxID=106549 RepID=A0A540KE30_MALBA|nr:hypothetical protein C1H46_041976 [Malus baccata]
MLRRSILQIASRRGLRRRIPRPIAREFSAAASRTSSHHPGGAPNPPPPGKGGSSAKIFLGSAAVGAGFVAAYKTGYLDPIFGAKEKSDSVKDAAIGFEDHKHVGEEKHDEERAGIAEEKVADGNKPESDITSEKGWPEYSQNATLGSSSEGNVDVKSAEEETSYITRVMSKNNGQLDINIEESLFEWVLNEVAFGETLFLQVALGIGEEPSGSLLKAYHLKDEANESIEFTNRQDGNEYDSFPNEKEALNVIKGLNDAYISKDEKLVLDFLQAIHTAEKRQAELDANVFSEEKRRLKEKYEKELKDAGARELMLAEEAAMLDKELKREGAKAAAALKSLQEKLEEIYKTELEHKESEADMKLKKVEELAKAGLAAAIAREKTSQIEKMAEANLHGALALDDALSKGLPIEREVEALQTYLECIDKDSILDVVLSSLPEETRRNGTDTLLQLNQKFDALKGTVRHLSLIPLGGGGILAHSLAHIAILVKEDDHSGDGIESIIKKVEYYLAEGKIAEAAEAFEGVKGTQATEVVGEWVKRARNRAITDQALTLSNLMLLPSALCKVHFFTTHTEPTILKPEGLTL